MGAGVTHEEWAAVVPRYAAGELEEAQAEAVRDHLATGCARCLEVLFRLPVGRPRDVVLAQPGATRSLIPIGVALSLVALAFSALVGWTIFDLREREADQRAESDRLVARVADLEATRREAVARLEAAQSDLDTARAEATKARAAAAAASEAREETARTLATAEQRVATLERGVRRRDAEIERLLGRAAERTTREWPSSSVWP